MLESNTQRHKPTFKQVKNGMIVMGGENFDEYIKVNKKLFEDYDPRNRKNLSVYEEAMRKLSTQ